MNILILFEKIAIKIKPYQRLSYSLVILSIVIIALLLIIPDQVAFIDVDIMSDYGRLGLLGFIWLLLFNLVSMTFVHVPQLGTKDDSVFTRLKLRAKRFFYYLLALFFVGLTIIIIALTVRMLRV